MNIQIGIGDFVQIGIALTLLATGILSYISLRVIKSSGRIALFTKLIEEERKVNTEINSYELHKIKDKGEGEHKHKQARELLFSFYEYLSILLFRKEIDVTLFYQYFRERISIVYLEFIADNCHLKSFEERIRYYPFLSQLFNELGLSIERLSIAKDIHPIGYVHT
jgi:hypothetical protein